MQIIQIACFDLSCVTIVHAFLQTSSNPQTIFRSNMLNANQSMFVNNLQKYGFPLCPHLVGINTRLQKFPVLVAVIVTKFGTIDGFSSLHYWRATLLEVHQKFMKHINKTDY